MKYRYITTAIFYVVMVTGLLQVSSVFAQRQVIALQPGKPWRLEVGLYEGDISIQGYAGNEIVIDAVFPPKNSGERIEVQKGDDGLIKISTPLLSPRCVLKLKIPEKNVAVKLGTVLNGNIELSGVQGNVEVDNVSGNLLLTGISGTVLANTVNGNVTVKMTSVKPGTPLTFSSVSGAIDVSLPANINADVRLKSDIGTLTSDFDVEDKSKQKLIFQNQRSTAMGGKGWLGVKINAGGTDVLITNVSGNITLRKNH
ncbi:hypothetical protein GA0116948_10193 [Chitinophaga costaii]|uniref:DUF4097 domain-containing protein n=1 Tax=Chitinophaga costaii TaxID=1335309 RepID=A0A1C3YSY6_9BACT|nr:DUF4097 family beta strand repeat-containing protein [Chitinophaga costaii]SCB73216.1 hypothetical protein GA0116948_10193 [Chitinophaga costaii]